MGLSSLGFMVRSSAGGGLERVLYGMCEGFKRGLKVSGYSCGV